MTEQEYQDEIQKLKDQMETMKSVAAEKEYALQKQLDRAREKVTKFGQTMQAETKARLEAEHNKH